MFFVLVQLNNLVNFYKKQLNYFKILYFIKVHSFKHRTSQIKKVDLKKKLTKLLINYINV